MSHCIVALLLVHHRTTLVSMCGRIIANAHNQIHVRKEVFRLHQLPRVSLMEQIVDTVSVHSHTTRCFASTCVFQFDLRAVIDTFTLLNRVYIRTEWGWFVNCLQSQSQSRKKKILKKIGANQSTTFRSCCCGWCCSIVDKRSHLHVGFFINENKCQLRRLSVYFAREDLVPIYAYLNQFCFE